MLLKMKLSLCGPELSLAPGDQHDFDKAEGQRLIDAGFAELAIPETAEERVARLEAELAEAKATLPTATSSKPAAKKA